MQYKLQQEVITPYTSTQQEQYNAIKNLKTYKDLTYVESYSEELSPNLELQYWKQNGDVEQLENTPLNIDSRIENPEVLENIDSRIENPEVLENIDSRIENLEVLENIDSGIETPEVLKNIDSGIENPEVLKNIDSGIENPEVLEMEENGNEENN